MNEYKIILFDGICNLCNSSVNFIIDRDRNKNFKFASIQSETGNNYLKQFNIEKENLKTIILIENNIYYLRSDAVLKIAKSISFPWKLAYIFIIVPQFIRDSVYNFIAGNRYSWFGKMNSCRVPIPELKDRFL